MKKNTELTSFGNWELKKRLGEGGFGEVVLWQQRHTKQQIATKRLKENERLSVDEISKLQQRWQQEYDWMRNLNTTYIVRGIDINDKSFVNYLNERHAWHPLPVIIMEYCNSGDVRSHLEKIENINGLHEFEVREILRALRHAVEYLHTKCGIEHRDLKPDNIVINQEGDRRTYKLTDFGFARKTTENTQLKSVVGTRHYFAPEVVDTAKYTNTVDYWSVGVIAFELLCGVRPFIPHQDLFHIIVNIKKKPKSCIAITEDPEQPNRFLNRENVFAENRMSSVFVSKIEEWLRLALDADYKTRGKISDLTEEVHREKTTKNIPFYAKLDAILDSKIITVFCLYTYEFYSYEITPGKSENLLFTSDFFDKLVEWTGLLREQLYFVLPPLHPAKALTPKTRLIDVFVQDWQDTSNSFNPPVMLYVSGYQCGYKPRGPYVSDIIKHCINLNNIEEKTGKWLMPHFELHVHFLLSNEQRHLETFLSGLKDYLLTIEHDIFNFESTVQTFLDEILILNGCARQYHKMISVAKSVHEHKIPGSGAFFLDWLSKAEAFSCEINKVFTNIGLSVKKRYNSVSRRTREETTNKIYDEYPKKDIFELKTIRHYIKNINEKSDLSARLNICQKAVYNCLEKRQNFLSDKKLKKSQELIKDFYAEYKKIQNIIKDTKNFLIKFDGNITRETENFHKALLNMRLNNGITNMAEPKLESIPNIKNTALYTSLNDIFNLNTDLLIAQAMKSLQLIEMEFDGR